MDDQLDDAGEFTANAAIDAAIGLRQERSDEPSGELAEGAEKLGKAGKRARQVEEGVAEHVHRHRSLFGRVGQNHLQSDPDAVGPHSTFRRDSDGNVKNHAEWTPNSKNPSGFDQSKQ